MPPTDPIPNPVPGPSPEKGRADAYEHVAARLASLEEKLEADGLGWESDYKKKLLAEIDQRVQLRQIAFVASGFVMVIMVCFAYAGLNLLAESETGTAIKAGVFVAPVVSITAITIMLVIGAFKRSRDEDTDKVSVPNLLSEVLKSSGS